MPYAHFLVPAEGGDAEQRLRDFLRQRAVLKIEQRFVDRPEGAFWAYAVHYDEGSMAKGLAPAGRLLGKDRVDYQKVLSEGDFALYVKLRDWRRELAEKEGLPPFSIFHNAAMAAIAQARPRTAVELQQIEGIGSGKVERYAEAVLQLVAETQAEPKMDA